VSPVVLACLGALLSAQPALACSVCYGDPNSAMNQGAQAGLLVLMGVIGTVLVGIASLMIFWWRRAVHLAAQVEAGEQASHGLTGSRAPFPNA
jgi:hypothetical protein